ncbi:hypothetical protein D3C59_29935 [Streptomyces sp. SHP22-7]|nr:hypothetical protein D3C59_29935 [Streptomyces sp. SHP22-7]
MAPCAVSIVVTSVAGTGSNPASGEAWTSTRAQSIGITAPSANPPSHDAVTPPSTGARIGAVGTGGGGPFTMFTAVVPSPCTPSRARRFPFPSLTCTDVLSIAACDRRGLFSIRSTRR